ncbi:hypothetical protein [Enterococcus sp. CSURQ0835]|uniref:hypothetical protein n=1 Tax=Enterococcus sp. CSURQ0835 TaxID=2681394 RepID=UPI00135BA3E4|nr:hypothetical protein [Enterococcus sp. CSURQ0835]
MIFAKKVIDGCEKIDLTTPTFLRMTFFQKTSNQDLKRLAEQALRFVLVIKQALSAEIITIQKINCLKNQQTIVFSGRFSDQTLFNIALALYPVQQEPLFKVEVVAKNGMVQYDTAADNAFTSLNYQLDYLTFSDKRINVGVFLNELDLAVESFGKVVS